MGIVVKQILLHNDESSRQLVVVLKTQNPQGTKPVTFQFLGEIASRAQLRCGHRILMTIDIRTEALTFKADIAMGLVRRATVKRRVPRRDGGAEDVRNRVGA